MLFINNVFMFAIPCLPPHISWDTRHIYREFNQTAVTLSNQAIDDRDSNGFSTFWWCCSVCASCLLVLALCCIHSVMLALVYVFDTFRTSHSACQKKKNSVQKNLTNFDSRPHASNHLCVSLATRPELFK